MNDLVMPSFVVVNESDVCPTTMASLQALQDSAHGFTCVVNVCTVCDVCFVFLPVL